MPSLITYFFCLSGNLRTRFLPQTNYRGLMFLTNFNVFVGIKRPARKASVPSMQTNGNCMAPSLVNMPYGSAAPNHTTSLGPGWRLLSEEVPYHREKQLCCLLWYSERFSAVASLKSTHLAGFNSTYQIIPEAPLRPERTCLAVATFQLVHAAPVLLP